MRTFEEVVIEMAKISLICLGWVVLIASMEKAITGQELSFFMRLILGGTAASYLLKE